MRDIKAETFGDPKSFPSLNSLAEILNEMEDGQRHFNSVSSLIHDMHSLYHSLNSINKKERSYFQLLLRNDLLKRLGERNFPDKINTHLRNYIIGFYRMKKDLLKR